MTTWGGYEQNIAYNPDKCGLRIVGELEDGDASYSFDTVLVVQDIESGRVYAAHDSGCSCPTPFEDVTGLGDMTEIRSGDDMRRFIDANDSTYKAWHMADATALVRKVEEVLAA